MSNMSTKEDSYRVVFLIDAAFLTNCQRHTSRQRLPSLIARSILLLLSYYSGKTRDQTKQLQWSYKLYNIEGRKGRQAFKDFDYKSFQDLESDLNAVVDGAKSKKSSDVTEGEEDDEPSHKLRKGLTDILHDFQWDQPDIMSPVKPTHNLRKRKSHGYLLNVASQQHNLVFVFSLCPRTLGDVLNFGDCDENSWQLLHTFMPKQLYHKFRNSFSISLFWVDVDGVLNLDQRVSSDVGGMQLMNNALSHMGGAVIPINALLSVVTRSNVLSPTKNRMLHTEIRQDAKNAAATENSDEGHMGRLWPLSTTMDFYTSKLSVQSACIGDTLKEQAVLVTCSGSTQRVLCSLNLQPVVTRMASHCHMCGAAICCCSRSASGEMHFHFVPPGGTTSQIRVGSVGSDTTANGDATLIVVRATVPVNQMSLRCCQSDVVFTATPELTSRETDDVIFRDILKQLTSQRLLMVVECSIRPLTIPVMAILQPVTFSVATLTLLRSDISLLAIDKLLQFNVGAEAVNDNKTSAASALEEFKDRTVSHLLKSVPSQSYSTAVKTEDTVARVAVKDTRSRRRRQFHSTYLEDWLTGSHVKSMNDLLAELHTDIDASSHGHQWQQQLRRHYREKHCQWLPGSQPSQRSPRKRTASELSETGVTLDAPLVKKARTSTDGCRRRSLRYSQSSDGQAELASVADGEISRARRGSLGVATRTDLIIQRSRKVALSAEPAVGAIGGSERAQTRSTTACKFTEFSTEQSLHEWLMTTYDQTITGQSCLAMAAHSLVHTSLNHYKIAGHTSSQEAALAFVRQLLVGNSQIREKFNGQEGVVSCEEKVREYQLQVLLRFEMQLVVKGTEVTTPDHDAMLQEMVMMLRAMSFLKESGFLAKYLSDVLLVRYGESCGQLLADIYDELLQPLPTQLQDLLSPDGTERENPPASAVAAPSVGNSLAPSVDNGLSQASERNKTRNRKLTRHSSFHSAATRQIAVSMVPKVNVTRTTRSSSRNVTVAHDNVVDVKPETKRVCRNLFRMKHNRAATETDPPPTVVVETTAKKRCVYSAPRRSLFADGSALSNLLTPVGTPPKRCLLRSPRMEAASNLQRKFSDVSGVVGESQGAASNSEEDMSITLPSRTKQSVCIESVHSIVPQRCDIRRSLPIAATSGNSEVQLQRTCLVSPRLNHETTRRALNVTFNESFNSTSDAAHKFMTETSALSATPPRTTTLPTTPRRSTRPTTPRATTPRRATAQALTPQPATPTRRSLTVALRRTPRRSSWVIDKDKSSVNTPEKQTQLAHKELKTPEKLHEMNSANTPCKTASECKRTLARTPRKTTNDIDIRNIISTPRKTPQRLDKNEFSRTPRKDTKSPANLGKTVQTPHKTKKVLHQRRTSAATPKVHHELKTRVVHETPARKQLPNVVWRHQERRRRHSTTDSKTDVMCVQESPDKITHSQFLFAAAQRRSPRHHDATRLMMPRRASFYGTAPSAAQSRVAQRCHLLEQRLTRRTLLSPKAAPLAKMAPDETTTARRRIALFSQIA